MEMKRFLAIFAVVVAGAPGLKDSPATAGDPDAGARAFRACAACHSLEPGRHLTGPSLAGLWHKKAGTVEGFRRYSPAMKASSLTWNESTLNDWLADPKRAVPGNRMTFPGIRDPKAREDLVAFLKEAGTGNAQRQTRQGGMAQSPALSNLKELSASQQVTAIRYCQDTYYVINASGETIPFWELNLRFKTDSTDTGPKKGTPALMPAGMMGDRASVIFADPAEISASIERRC
jgi:cytochrome c